MDDKIKYYLVMRNDVIELGFKNMDKFGADLFCLVMREIRRNVEKLNKNTCTFEYRELKEILNIDDHLSYEMYKKEIDRFKKTIMSCWYEFENEEIGVEMAVFTEVSLDELLELNLSKLLGSVHFDLFFSMVFISCCSRHIHGSIRSRVFPQVGLTSY